MVEYHSETQRPDQLKVFKENDEIDIIALSKIFLHEKILISTVTFLFAALSIIYALSLPNLYKADSILAPNIENQPFENLKGLSSLVGIKPNHAIDEVARTLEVIKSRQFVNRFVKRHKITPELFAMTSWDAKNKKPVFDLEIYDAEKKEWTLKKQKLDKGPPNAFEIHERFMKMLSVKQDQDTNFITISIETVSPEYSYQWLTWLIHDINETVRDKKVKETQKSITYLEDKALKTQISEVRSIFYDLIQEKVQAGLLAETLDEYILQTIDPPLVPQEKSAPSRAIICILGTIAGGILGLMLGLIRYYRK